MPMRSRAARRGATLVMLLCLAGAAQAGDSAAGKRLYDSRCAFCHGTAGQGDGPAGAALKPPPTNFTSADFWKGVSSEQLKASIADGKPGTAMVGFKAALSAEQIDDVLTYLRTFPPH